MDIDDYEVIDCLLANIGDLEASLSGLLISGDNLHALGDLLCDGERASSDRASGT